MNWNYFNTLGYLSVILWLLMPVLWFVHSRMRPRKWVVHIAILVGVAALVLAKINSDSYVSRIQLDRSEQIAALEAEKEAKRKAALDARGEDVADVRFAEDDGDDFLDRAGMDESELKYTDKQLGGTSEPAWKKEKRTRDSGGEDDDSLEDLIGAEEETEGVESEELEAAAEAEPIYMGAEDLEMANRLDSMNLKVIRYLLMLGVILLITDYFRRANNYEESYLPLPVPGPWKNAFSQAPAVQTHSASSFEKMADQLRRFTKRGESFLYLTDESSKASQLPEAMPKFGKKRWLVDVLRLGGDGGKFRNDFVFESLWYGRSSFVVDSREDSEAILNDFTERLEKRSTAKARVNQTVHIVWDLQEAMPVTRLRSLSELAEKTGFSIFLQKDNVRI